MERIDNICSHPLWLDSIHQITLLEKERVFCRHGVSHLLDVARIAWIENLESELQLPKDMVYAAALLHDIGRHRQYLDNIPHHEASAQIAADILPDAGFDDAEQTEILNAILMHREKDTADTGNIGDSVKIGYNGIRETQNDLAELIRRADKKSRMCALCPAIQSCNWDNEKKNMRIEI